MFVHDRSMDLCNPLQQSNECLAYQSVKYLQKVYTSAPFQALDADHIYQCNRPKHLLGVWQFPLIAKFPACTLF